MKRISKKKKKNKKRVRKADLSHHSSSWTLALRPKFRGLLARNAPTAPRYPSWRRKYACLLPLLQNLMAKDSVWIV
jgi:hypothetical protein